ncbi:MAG: hypothetical protein Q9173_001746 [Seirophora scorigena]
MWNRILGKNDSEKSPSKPDGQRRSDTHRSTLRRSDSLKSTTSSRKGTRDDPRDRGFNPVSTSYSSTTRNQHPGTAQASVGTSFDAALNDPTSDQYRPPALFRNASLANQKPTSTAGGDEPPAGLDSNNRSKKGSEESSAMDRKRSRKERRGTRDRDDDRRDKKSGRDSKGGKEPAVSIDDTAYTERSTSGRATSVSDGRHGTSSFVSNSRPESLPGQQSSHVQDQFPGQFSASSATPYRPPLAAREGGPGLAAEYYGDAGQSVAEQPGIRPNSPSLIIGAEPHLQPASAVAAPPPEPSASGGVGAAASFFDGSFNAGSDIEDHHGPNPFSRNEVSLIQHTSAAPAVSSYATSSANMTNQHSSSAPVVPTLGAAAAGAIAGYYSNNHHFQPERPEHTSSTASGYGQIAGNSSHQQSVSARDQNTIYSSSSRPQAQPDRILLPITMFITIIIMRIIRTTITVLHYTTRMANVALELLWPSSIAIATTDPDGVAQFEEYTEFIGVCRHCFAPGSSPRDAPRRHNYRRRRSSERFGSSVRVDKDSRYWSSENEGRRQKNKSWLGAGMAGYGLAKMGESLFKPDLDSDDSHSVHSGRVRRSHRRGSSSSSERRSRTSRGVVHRSSDTLSRRSRSNDQVANGVTSDGKLYRKDSHGRVHTSAVEVDMSRRRSRSRSRDQTRKISEAALGGAAASALYASTPHRRGSSPEKIFVRSKHDDGSRSELGSVARRGDSQHHDSQRRSRRSPEPPHRKSRRKEKTSRGFFTFSNGSSSSSGSSDVALGTSHQRKLAKETKSNKKRKSSREADAALLGLGAAAAALALNQNQRSRRKGELVAVKASKRKGKSGKNERKGKSSPPSSEEDLWESASEGERSSADSELAYGASLHGRSQESLSSDSAGMDKWSWRWGSKKQAKKRTRDQRHSPGFDHSIPPAAALAMDVPQDGNRQDSRTASSSRIPLQHVYPMPTSDPTQFDASGYDAEFPPHQPYVNARPHPVPMQHPQPVAPVSPAVYTTQSHYAHSYSAPNGPISLPQYPHPSMVAQESAVPVDSREQVPGAFPTGSEYFASLMQDSPTEGKPRQRDSSPVMRTSEHTSSSSGPRRRKSLKDDSSSVRFDLTKEQEDKDRREERRRRKEDDKRRERLERQDLEDRRLSEQDRATKRETSSKIRSERDTKEDSATVIKDSWAAPAAAGVIAAAIGATVVAKQRESSEDERSGRHDEARKHGEERDIEVIVKERHAPTESTDPEETEGHGRSSEKKPMSVWQAAAKIKRTSSHTDYAAYFTPSELLTKTGDVRQIVGANADNEVTVYQVPDVVTVEPLEFRGYSPARAYSFPIKAEDMEPRKKALPWSVPQLNLVEATPPPSRSASVSGSRSPLSPSPLSKEIPIDIPLEPLESLTDNDVTFAHPHNVEYTVIEPKDRSTPSVDSPVDETELPEAVPGISSLRNRMKPRESPPRADYGDDLDFTATVAAGLQDTGFDPSIVTDDPSFRRRDSPPGSEGDEPARSPTVVVTEIKSDVLAPRSPPHGFVEEISERHMPGSFDDDEEPVFHSRPKLTDGARSTEEATGPADNVGAQPHVYSIEPVPTETGAATNAAIDPVGIDPYKDRKVARRENVREEPTQPSDNAAIEPHQYTAEPQSFEPEKVRDLTMDPAVADRQPTSMSGGSAQGQPLVEESAYSSPDKLDYPSDDSGPVTASAPVISSSSQSSKSKKISKRRSVGFDDATSIVSPPATFEDKPKESGTPEKRRKNGIFGMFSRSIESLPESKGSRGTPVQANLEDFEEPKKRGKKSKSRKATWDEKVEAGAAEPYVPQEPEAQDDWSTSKKSKRGKEKRRSSEQDSGRITHDLPAQVITPALPRLDPSPSDEMLTNLEDPKADRSHDSSGPGAGIAETLERFPTNDDPEQSFLGERPEKPPLPDLPDASEDPGGQLSLDHFTPAEGDSPSPESQIESPATKADKQKWRLSDIQSSPSPTAVPLRPLRFGRRPSSPSLAKSLPSTPHASATVDQPFTPRRRERPHSTEFKSNEFRPIWLLEKHGSRQEPAPQETYPSLPSSHTTSRASSVHESDDPFQTEALGLAMGEPSVREHHGLAIDTSRGMFDSDFLDSQQATPTAASFHSRLQENNAPAQEDVDKHGWSQSDATDGAAVVDVSADPVDETTEETRSLHGLDDTIMQRRSISSSQYVTDVTAQTPTQTGAEAPRLLEEKNSGDDESASSITDAALGAFIGGSAVALSKSTGQQDGHPEASRNQADKEETPKDGEDLVQKPADEVPGRSTVEESRLRQEQDAQDAVDSWFTPTQPKRSQTRKGKKRRQSLEAVGPTRTVDTTAKVPSSVFEEAHFTAEPAETASVPHTDASRREPSPTAVNPSWQTALTTRKDLKGKKKKNKKSTDPWEDKSVVQDEPTAEPFPSIESPSEEIVKPPGISMADEVSVQRADAEASQEAAAVPTSSKKNRKAKKKGRQLLLTGLTPDDPEEGPVANEEGVNKQFNVTFEHPDVPTVQPTETLPSSSIEEAVPYNFSSPKEVKTPGVHDLPSVKQSDVPVVSTEVGFGPSRSMSEDVPYESPSPATLASKAPTEGFLSRVEPATNDAAYDEGPLQDSSHKDAPEENPTQQLPASAPHEDIGREPLPGQKSERAASESILSPENVPLPVDEDFDLAVPPDSPVILPVDSAQTPETSLNVLESQPKAPGRRIELEQDRRPSSLELLSGVALPGEPDDSPTVLTNAISELNLPEIASLDQPAESTRGLPEEESTKSDEQFRDEWPTFSTKKAKKGKKERKSELIETEKAQDNAGRQTPAAQNALTQESEDLASNRDPADNQAMPEKDSFGLKTAELEQDRRLVEASKFGESAGDTVTELVGEDAEWPTVANKKKKGKKNRRVAFDEAQDIQNEELQAPSVPEHPTATTSTAEEVRSLLHTPEPERGPEDAQPTWILQPDSNDPIEEKFVASSDRSGTMDGQMDAEKGQTPLPESLESLPTPRLEQSEAVAGQRIGAAQQESTAAQEPMAGYPGLASIETAAEVQGMLAGQKALDSSLSLVEDTPPDFVKPAEADDFAWGFPNEKGKEIKTAGDVADAVVETLENQQPSTSWETTSPTPEQFLSSEPAEEFSTKMSKKDEKNSRKGVSRTFSEVQEEESRSISTRSHEMAIAADAPSISEKTDKLPSTEMPMTPDVAHDEAPLSPLAEPVPDVAEKVQQGSDTTFAISPRPQADVTVQDETSGIPEMEIAMGAPSISEKHDDLPSMELPMSPEAVSNDGPSLEVDPVHSGIAAEEKPMSSIQEMNDVPLDVELPPSPKPVEEPLSWFEEDFSSQSAVPVSRAKDSDYLPSMSTKEQLDAAETPTRDQETSNEATIDPVAESANLAEESVLAPVIEEASTKSKRDKKKSKKAKALAWVDETPEAPTETVAPLDTDPPSVQATEPAVAESSAVFEEPPKSKKDKKIAKKARASAWEDDVPEASAEASEAQRDVTDITIDEPSLPVVEESPLIMEEPLESKKGKKKTKKSKALSLEEDESTNPPRDELQQQEFTSIGAEALDGRSNEVEPLPVDESFRAPEEQSKSKKSKKKGKKAKFVGWDDEPSGPSAPADDDEPVEDVAVAERTLVGEEVLGEENVEVPDNLASSKKSKKKGKKSKSVAWDDKPLVLLSTDEIEQGQVTDGPQEAEDNPDVQAPADAGALEGDEFLAPQSKALPCEDEQPTSTSQAPDSFGTTPGLPGQFIETIEEPQVDIPKTTDEAAPDLAVEVGLDLTVVETERSSTEPMPYFPLSDQSETVREDAKIPREDVQSEKDNTLATISDPFIEPVAVDQQVEDASTLQAHPGDADASAPFTGDAHKTVEEVVPFPAEETINYSSTFQAYPGDTDAKAASAPSIGDAHTTAEEVIPLPAEETAENADAKAASAPSTGDAHKTAEEMIPLPVGETVEDADAKFAFAPSAGDAHKTAEEMILLPVGETVEDADAKVASAPSAGDVHKTEEIIPLPAEEIVEDASTLQSHPGDADADAKVSPAPTGGVHKSAEERIPLSAEETVDDSSMLFPGATHDPSEHDAIRAPADDLTPAKSQSAPCADDTVTTAEEVIPLRSQGMVEASSLLPSDASYEPMGIDTMPTLADASAPVENQVAPSTDDANKSAEGAVPLPNEEPTVDQYPLSKHIEDDAVATISAPTVADASKSAKEQLPSPLEEMTNSWPDAARDVPREVADLAPLPGIGDVDVAEDLPTVSKKEKKKAKKARKAMAWDDEAGSTRQADPAADDFAAPAEPELESEASTRALAEEPPALAEPGLPESVETFPSFSKKDKKKTKEGKKALSWEEEEPTEVVTLPGPEAGPEVAPVKVDAPASLETAEAPREFPSISKKEKKKAKKSKKSLAFDEDEPSLATPPAMEAPVVAAQGGHVPSPPIEEMAEPVEEFPSLSKKVKKKKKKSPALDEEPSENVTPPEPDLEGPTSDTMAVENPATFSEPLTAEAAADTPSASNLDQQGLKKDDSLLTFDSALSESIAPVEEARPVQMSEDVVEETFLPVDTSTPADESASPGKQEKNALAFDDELSETTAPAEFEPANELVDPAVEASSLPTEGDIGEDNDSLLLSKKEKKKPMKAREAKSFVDDESYGTILPTALQPIMEVADEGAREADALAEPSPSFDEFPSEGRKEKAMSKQDEKSLAFDEEPLEDAKRAAPVLAVEPLGSAKRSMLPAEPGTAENEEFFSMSKKDRKKAKKGKKALAFDDDEPSGTTTPTIPNPEADIVGLPEAPPLPAASATPEEEFLSVSKKGKRKGKKAKKAVGWEDEVPGTVPQVQSAEAFDQLQAQNQVLPAARELEHAEDVNASAPQDILSDLATRTGPVKTGFAGLEAVLEAEPAAPASGKKGKKDKKKAKKAQALDWDDEVAAEPTLVPAAVDPISGTQSNGLEDLEPAEEMIDDATKQADVRTPIDETPAPPTVSELELAPRHERPAAVGSPAEYIQSTVPPTTDASHDGSQLFQAPATLPGSNLQPQADVHVSLPAQEPPAPSIDPTEDRQNQEEQATSGVQEAPMSRGEEDFTSFITTKKFKKGKKAKKEPIIWEDDTATPPAPVQEASSSREGIHAPAPAPSRPEMAAWPTEVRLNQAGGITGVQEQLGGFADAYALRDQPPEPPAVADGRDDYFGSTPGYDMVHPPQPYEYEARSGRQVSPAPEFPLEGIAPEREESPNLGDASATVTTAEPDSAKEEVDQRESANEPSRSRHVTTEPTNELDTFASKKKDKKSKRKQKKQVVDDVMWEFPSMAPPLPPVAAAPGQEQVPPAQDLAGSDPVREEELHGRTREAPTVEPQSLVEPETITEGDISRDAGSTEHEDVKVPAESQATTTEDQADVPEESHVEGTVEDDWNAVPKKGKKATMSRENKEVELGDFLPQPTQDPTEIDAPIPRDNMASGSKDAGLNTSRDDLGTAEHHLSKDETSATPLASAGEAMATAAAVGAGLVAAEQLGRKEAKKGKKSEKDRQASSTWAEADEESTPMADVPAGANRPERGATPEGRRSSPIQAWHQYISPGQSPTRSELYDIEDDRPRSAGSARRKRSYDQERSGIPTPERRSPVAAWHVYNTPGYSPQQHEISEHAAQQATAGGDGASSKQFNRDSAVHVMDSPIVPDRSPVRRAMRDSGYPDTEASPIVGVGDGYQEAVDAASGEDHSYEKADLPGNTIRSSRSLEDPRDPSPVRSTTKERSSLLFHSSPSTREEHEQQQQRERVSGYDEASGISRQDGRKQAPPPMGTPSEDDSATVKARAESLAALSGLSGARQDAARPSLFGGPVGISSDGETALDAKRRRLNTISEYNPEESPVHNRNREVSDVGAPDHGVKTARRSGTPQAISQRRAGSPSPEQGKGTFATDDSISHLSWPAGDEEKQREDMERSRSRGTEQRSNMSSLVSSLPKQREYERRSLSGASNHSVESINAIIRTPPDPMRSASGMSNRSSGTPPLRRSDRSVSGDLRGATNKNHTKKNRKGDAKEGARQSKAEAAEIITPEPHRDPNTERRTGRVRDMANVLEGYGDFRASPVSPTRPSSMRRRQSMQVMELESKLDQLVHENRTLQDARQRAERGLQEAARHRGQEMESYRDAIETRNAWIQEKDTEIVDLKATLESLQSQVQHLTDVNQALHAASRELEDHQERYGQLEEEHADTYQQWQQSTRELESLKDQHAQLSAGMENIVRHEVSIAVEGKTAELHRLQSELDTAKEQIRALQAQILAAKNNPSTDDDIIPDRDEDYFDTQCQSLCTAIQQWVLRFSKFSDHRACYLSSELRDEKTVDRIENAMLDGSDPDAYLGDRVRRRHVFASVLMTMAWEYIFTRYLFGADREQRQKLKSLEKQLADSRSTPMAAVHRWRATTLALLSRRDAFVRQRAQDTDAIMHTVYDTLAAILPPPAHLVAQIQQSLRKVLDKAVDLAVEMRTQRAEYVMLPPLQPEYDTHGDLARLVYFNAALMHERGGGGAESNEELEGRRAVVRMVLFPLVVKKGDDGGGGGGEEIVVCPAQVLVAREEKEGEGKGKGKSVRVVSAQASDVNMENMF